MQPMAIEVFAWLAPWIVQVTLLSIAACCLLQVGRRWSPALRHAIVAVAWLAFVIPPFLDVPVLPSPGSAVGAMFNAAAAPGSVWHLPTPILVAGVVAWGSGTVLILATMLAQMIYINRLRRRARATAPAWLHQCLDDVIMRVGLKRTPRLLVSEDVAGPCVAGLSQPAVLLPAILAGQITQPAARQILAHELAHLRQHDLWLNGMRAVLCALWWPHPFVWLLARESRRIREDACDDVVLRALEVHPAEYADTLLRSATAVGRRRLALVSVGVQSGSAKALGQRLQRLGDPRVARTPRLSRLQLAGLALGCVITLNSPAVDVQTSLTGDPTITFRHGPTHHAEHGSHHGPNHRPPWRR